MNVNIFLNLKFTNYLQTFFKFLYIIIKLNLRNIFMTLKKLAFSSVVATLFSGCLSINMADTGMFNDLGDLKAHLAEGDDINFQDKDGDTALINSALFGNLNNVKYLLDHGAKLDIRNNNGDNAFLSLFLFDKSHDKEILDLLLAKGVNINQKNSDGETALFLAISYGLDKHVAMLLEKGADITILNNEGESPLSEICLLFKFKKAKRVIDTLIEKGVDLNLKDAEGDTISSYVDCQEDKKLFSYLKSKGLK